MEHHGFALIDGELHQRLLDRAGRAGIALRGRGGGHLTGSARLREVLAPRAAAAQGVAPGVGRDRVDPGPHRRARHVPTTRAHDRQKGRLQQVLCERLVPDHPGQESMHRSRVSLIEHLEGGLVARAEPRHEGVVREGL